MIWRCGRLGKLRLKNADDAFDESSCQFGRRRLGDMVLILGGCAMADGVRAVSKVPLYRILFFCLLLLSFLPCCKEFFLFVKVLDRSDRVIAFGRIAGSADIPVRLSIRRSPALWSS
jgi:hypothetical protein